MPNAQAFALGLRLTPTARHDADDRVIAPRAQLQQPPDLSSGLVPAVVDKNFARQCSLQK
jgi:hypothetical protein